MVRRWWNAVRTCSVVPNGWQSQPSAAGSYDIPPAPTARETATILSVPTVLWLVYFLFQPVFAAWRRLGYLREPVAARAPAARVAPEPFAAHADLWHGLTRVSHALIHQPSSTHGHVVGNVLLIALLAWALLTVLTALGRRSLFVFAYWELVVAAPVVGSFAFDLLGRTPHGYGASTIGFAFLGIVAVVSLVVLADAFLDRWTRRPVSKPMARPDGGSAGSPLFAGLLFLSATAVIGSDLLAASPATPVHQAGVVCGVLVGLAVVLLGDGLRGIVTA